MDYARFNLPVAEIAASVCSTLAEYGAVVLTAPPGAGKSTLLPLAIMDSIPQGRILMLEPRRIAARQIACRMADMLGEAVGKTVGYRIRFENVTGPETRIEVLTEGILSRMLADDPALDGVAAIIFDEFHERSLASDEALALAIGTRDILRPDLKIAIMSATIDASAIASAVNAPVIESPGRCFPVEIVNLPDMGDTADAASACARQIMKAHREQEGDILAFLPGEAEIRKCQEIIEPLLPDARIFPLYGMLPIEQQRRAIEPSADGSRRIVLATPVAETSLTIEGVRIVVDSGLYKKTVYNPKNGLSRLETVRISMDMADQRAGRAGRLAPGICYRLWSKATESRMQQFRSPEILEADLSSVCLDAAVWGEGDITALDWITTPPAASVDAACKLLESLGAIEDGRLTPHGRRLNSFPCHPRIANMLSAASTGQQRSLAADIAAVLEDRDPMQESAGADLSLRVEELRRQRSSGHIGRGWNRIARGAQQYARMLKVPQDNSPVYAGDAGMLLARAYPLRVARLRADAHCVYQMAGGENCSLDASDALSSSEWIVVADVNARRDAAGRIYLACPVEASDLMDMAVKRDVVAWDSRGGSLAARTEWRIGTLTLMSRPLSDISRGDALAIIAAAAVKEGASMFDMDDKARDMQRRIAAASAWHPELELPDCSCEALYASAAGWLPLYGPDARSIADLRKIDMSQVIWGQLDYNMQKEVERIAPDSVIMPSGRHARLEYRLGADAPVLRVRLQECFGMKTTPVVDGGRVKVLMELLSPGFKPVQLTSDLESFWSGTYFEVRKELRRRYPKHQWPDNPLEAYSVK